MGGWSSTGRSLVLGPIGLLLLLAALAWLQFRWTGELSRAEAERLQSSLSSALGRFSDDFDDEIARTWRSFFVSSPEDLPERLARWREEAGYPELVDEVFLVHSDASGGRRLSLSKLEGSTFAPASWSEELFRLKSRLERAGREARRVRIPPLPIGAGDRLALVVPSARQPGVRADNGTTTVLTLRESVLREELLPELAARHFGSDIDAVVVDPSGEILFSTGESPREVVRSADATSRLLSLRRILGRLPPPERDRLSPPRGHHPPPHPRALDRGRGEASFLREQGRDLFEGRWEVFVRHRAGSVEAAVGRARRRNLLVGLGVLAVLGTSVVLVTISARRATELGNRKMEFVAGVSHELRTPIAVIRSAAQNLADGSVAGPDAATRYGSLIDAEGRRLEDLVEQVLELAGVQSRRRPEPRSRLPVAELLEEAVSDAKRAARDREVPVSISLPPEELHVVGERDSLRRALSNLVANAVKHGDEANAVSVSVERRAGSLRISVRDRGPGIPEEDRKHLFEPFYRGQRARERQVPGSGLGLSLVAHVAREHGGRVEVLSAPGEGSEFILTLPEAPREG